MPWPFTLPFTTNDYLNSISSLTQSLIEQNIRNNQILNSITQKIHYKNSFNRFNPLCLSNLNMLHQKYRIMGQLPIQSLLNSNNKIDNVIISKIREAQQAEKELEVMEVAEQNLKNKESLEQDQQKPQGEPTFSIQPKMVRFRRRRASNRPKNIISHNSSLRNDTKNIPKNYGKAMLNYIQKNCRQVKNLLDKYEIDYLQFMLVVKSFKAKINTIHDLRQMWGESQKDNTVKRCLRILSYHFMRIKCLPYIFNSRIKNFKTHIKYRKKIMEGIENPESFTKIKEF